MTFNLPSRSNLNGKGSGAANQSGNITSQDIKLLTVLSEASTIAFQDLGGCGVRTSSPTNRSALDQHSMLKRAITEVKNRQYDQALELSRMAEIAMSRQSDDAAHLSVDPREARDDEPYAKNVAHQGAGHSSSRMHLSQEDNRNILDTSMQGFSVGVENAFATPPVNDDCFDVSSFPPPPHHRKPSISAEDSDVSSVDLVAAVSAPALQEKAPKARTHKGKEVFQCKPRYAATWLSSLGLQGQDLSKPRGTKSTRSATMAEPSSMGTRSLGRRFASMPKLSRSRSKNSANQLSCSHTSLPDQISVRLSTVRTTKVSPCANASWDDVQPASSSARNVKKRIMKITPQTLEHMEKAVNTLQQRNVNKHNKNMQESRNDTFLSHRSLSEVSLKRTHSSSSSFAAMKKPSMTKASSFSSNDKSLGTGARMRTAGRLSKNGSPRRCNPT